jgi:AcrR family transcriptional regulator
MMTKVGMLQRSRNGPATRIAILAAARNRFAHDGYDGAGLRDIAADVGVDAALVCRYFGSKEDLFAEALGCASGVGDLMQGDVEGFGERVARYLVLEPRDDCKLATLLMVLRSASSPRATAVIRRNSQAEFYGPIESWLGGGADAPVRARLLAGVITGFAISRAVDENYALDDAQRMALCAQLATLLQQVIDGVA